MPELRRDPVTGGWVILAPERKVRPQFYQSNGDQELTPNDCPFCEGNEDMTPPEVAALRDNHGAANQAGWTLRVVPNKYPALRVEGDIDRKPEGFYDKMNGIGAHEVVIETKDHYKDTGQMDTPQVEDVFLTYKYRILDLKQDIRFKYIQVFKNQGAKAGATIPHPHSQIVALPVVPGTIQKQLSGAESHYLEKERCIYCDIVAHEAEHKKRVLIDTNDYIVLCPFAAKFPFSLKIYPKHHHAAYQGTDDTQLRNLASVFKETIVAINNVLDTPAYNMVLHNAPFDRDTWDYFHWHIEIVPMISGTGGFELATHSYINSIPPEEAIKILKSASGRHAARAPYNGVR
jgi:UDPglucose--hexose-1-phosphate uridylyltransferase